MVTTTKEQKAQLRALNNRTDREARNQKSKNRKRIYGEDAPSTYVKRDTLIEACMAVMTRIHAGEIAKVEPTFRRFFPDAAVCKNALDSGYLLDHMQFGWSRAFKYHPLIQVLLQSDAPACARQMVNSLHRFTARSMLGNLQRMYIEHQAWGELKSRFIALEDSVSELSAHKTSSESRIAALESELQVMRAELAGIKERLPPARVSRHADRLAEATALREDGWTLKQLADKYGVSIPAVSGWFKPKKRAVKAA